LIERDCYPCSGDQHTNPYTGAPQEEISKSHSLVPDQEIGRSKSDESQNAPRNHVLSPFVIYLIIHQFLKVVRKFEVK
jgi:hypothetical protein